MKVQNLGQGVLLGSEDAYFGGDDRGQRLSDRATIIHPQRI
jgi:hypothetical protein